MRLHGVRMQGYFPNHSKCCSWVVVHIGPPEPPDTPYEAFDVTRSGVQEYFLNVRTALNCYFDPPILYNMEHNIW